MVSWDTRILSSIREEVCNWPFVAENIENRGPEDNSGEQQSHSRREPHAV
jgi:hypothetical protein